MSTLKAMVTQFHARHGDCKIAGTLHFGFDWGYTLECKKKDVEMFLVTAPTDATQIAGIQLRPRTGAPKKCD